MDGYILMLFPTCVESHCLAQPCKSGLLVLTWKSNSFASDLTSRFIQLNTSSESASVSRPDTHPEGPEEILISCRL